VLPRSVFVHIPKTGGVWVRRAIAQAGLPTVEAGHAPITAGNMHNATRYINARDRIQFAFVRHPLNWYASFWSFRMFSGWSSLPAPLDACMSADFDRFIRNALRAFPQGWVGHLYRRYLGPTLDGAGFIGRTERLAEDLVHVLRLAGESFDEAKLRAVPQLNVSPIRPVYSRKLRQAVLCVEREIIERFGYDAETAA